MNESKITITPSKRNTDTNKECDTYSTTSPAVDSPEYSPASPPNQPPFTAQYRSCNPFLKDYKPEKSMTIHYDESFSKTAQETRDLGVPDKTVYKYGNRKYTFCR
ncbi:hypothetical protein NPIL_263491 [Nephila pilipes]|uniref:Uncharacterized protein n=1 Tax=Nephila pilipes TaxID=299642 RepID=A0A8X6U2E5_NEPPI|nr:hypothetical protein NPIL_263491 [Nephila pilipes]